MWRLILTIFYNFLFNFILALKILMLRLQNHSNYNFYCKLGLEDALCPFKILRQQLQNESYWLIQGEVNLIG